MNRLESGTAVVEKDQVSYKEIFEQGVKMARSAASLVSDSGTPRPGFRNSLPGLVGFFRRNFSHEQLESQAPFEYSVAAVRAAVRARFEITGNPNSAEEMEILRKLLGEQVANEYKDMKPFNQLTTLQAQLRLKAVADRLEEALNQSVR